MTEAAHVFISHTHDDKMIAEVGGTRKVMGSRIATPLTEPRPGMAPTNNPIAQPITTTARLSG